LQHKALKRLFYSHGDSAILQERRKLIIFSALLLGGFLVAVYLLPRKKTARTARSSEELLQLPLRQPGSAEVCQYWRPWETALAPSTPSDVMTKISQRARTRAVRTKAFNNWAQARPRSSEHVCAFGTTINNEFTFDLAKDMPTNFIKGSSACKPPPQILDFSMAMHVEKGPTANLNAFDLQISTGSLSAKRLRAFAAEQLQLIYRGYEGWEAAFPEFSQEQTSGIGIKHERKPLADDVVEINTHLAWNPQRFWMKVPTFATWLLNLGALVTVDTKVTDSSGNTLAHLITSTKDLGTRIRVPLTTKGIMPGWLSPESSSEAAPITHVSDFDIHVSHIITIGFKGLSVVVYDLAFHGTLTQYDDSIWYDGKFMGIGPVEVTGTYKGLAKLGMDDMIRTMIIETVEKEVATIQNGNNGAGWTVQASLAPSEDGSFNVARLTMELESPVHITELMRYEADRGNDVMPDKVASYEFKNYADSVLKSLLLDTHRFTCGQHH